MWLSIPEKRKPGGDFTAVCSSLNRGNRGRFWALLLETDDRMGTAQRCIRVVQTGFGKKFLYLEGFQTLEQASWRGR